MKNIAIFGSTFGDEAKGAITHNFSKDYNWVIRVSGGNNAGHTIYRDGVKYIHNLIPSFDWRHAHTNAFLGSNMVIDLEHLYNEVVILHKIDSNIPTRIFVDPDAFVITDSHKNQDKENNKHIGTTGKGIGPAYRDKVDRKGIRIRDVLNANTFAIKLKELGVNFKGVLELRDLMKSQRLIFEGAQGILLDINHGTYPYVTSSETGKAAIYSCGFSWVNPYCYGISKCYSTRVGEGPFPTEIVGPEGEYIRTVGKEVGAVTKRPRKTGWIDLPATKYAALKGGIDSLIITKFDVLTGMDTIKICTSYGKSVYSGSDFFDVKPEYVSIPGWKDHNDLSQLKLFIDIVKSVTELPVSYVTRGTSEKDIIGL